MFYEWEIIYRQVKIEAVRQITEKGYSIAEVADRLGTTTPILYAWVNKYDAKSSQIVLAQIDPVKELEIHERKKY
ncbi:transposase [Acinetobacter ursingii]|nr:transposase [Acinetobacter ursingii]MCU4505732.1 transposase [Acinetobacter ursingii]MCU4569678.1 transposase [Acinetobacter ursingii]